MRLFTSVVSLTITAMMTNLAMMVPTVFGKSGPTAIAYVEVNSNSITNVGRYTLTDGSNAFDIAIIFAANINYNGTNAVVYNNPQVQAVLDDAQNQIRPLQAKGIKVLLSLLGNHQGVGVSNFATQAAATKFAGLVRDEVVRYGLDGVDIDDEYADYGTNGQPQANANSIGWVISGLRSALGSGKLVTFYNFGPASQYLSQSPASVGSQLSFAWNAVYDSYQAPSVPGLTKAKLGPAAVDITSTPQSDAASFAKKTVSQSYGAYMTYDLQAGDHSTYISAITKGLYGLAAKYS